MRHHINNDIAQRSQEMFSESESDHAATHWQPPGQAKKQQHADDHSATSKVPDTAGSSHASPAHFSLIGWLKNKRDPALAAAQQRDAQQPGAPTHTDDNIKRKVAVAAAAATLVADNQLWRQHKHLDTAALKDIVAHATQYASATVQAAQTMLDNPMDFELAVDDHIRDHHKHDHQKRGHIWGEVSRQNLSHLAKWLVDGSMVGKHAADDEAEVARYREAALATVAARAAQLAATPPVSNDTELAQAASARHVLQADATLWAGKTRLGLHDLQHVLKHPDEHAPQTVNASLYMLLHPAGFSELAMTAAEPKT